MCFISAWSNGLGRLIGFTVIEFWARDNKGKKDAAIRKIQILLSCLQIQQNRNEAGLAPVLSDFAVSALTIDDLIIKIGVLIEYKIDVFP